MKFNMGEHSAELKEFIPNYEDMAQDGKTKAVMAFRAMGNQLAMQLKLNAEDFETKDKLRHMMDAFVWHMRTPGGYKFWKSVSDIDHFGDDVSNAVSARSEKLNASNNDFVNSAVWLHTDKS